VSNTETFLKALKSSIEKFESYDRDRMIYRQEWGTLNLKAAEDDFNRIYSLVGALTGLPLEELTDNVLQNINQSIATVNSLFEQINTFTIEGSNPSSQRDSFVSEIHSASDKVFNSISQWIPFLAYQKGDISRNISALSTALEDAKKLIEEAKVTIESKHAEIDSIVTAAREASASAGAAVFTKDFNEEHDKLSEQAKNWLIATGIFAALTLIAGLLFYFYIEANLNDGQIWQRLTTKLVILAFFLSSTIWCGRIYKALMHQSSLYRHRALSIQTLQAFVAAVADPNLKDMIVTEAARGVFGATSSGYIDNSKDGDGDIKLFEIAKSAFPKTSA
jgi:hypothetical protein